MKLTSKVIPLLTILDLLEALSSLSADKSWTSTTLPTASITDSVFILNKAILIDSNGGQGGAIYQTTSSQTEQSTVFTDCYFVSNTADILGGAIFFDYSPPSIGLDSIFMENYANKINHIGSYPIRLIQALNNITLDTTYIPGTSTSKSSENSTFYIWDNIGSGVTTSTTFTFALLDMYDQVVYSDNSSYLQIYPNGSKISKRATFSNKISLQATNGLYQLENFKFVYEYGESINVTFTSSAIPSPSAFPLPDITTVPSVVAEVNFRKCSLGEYIADSNGFAVCEECPSGFWQVNLISTLPSCVACDASTTICRGGNDLGPRVGYWRMNETANLVIKCPRPASCIGNVDSDVTLASKLNPVGECAHNYFGNLCNACKDGWAKNGNQECIDCKGNVVSYILIFVILGLQALLITYAVRATILFGRKYVNDDHSETNSANLLRILISYSQMYSTLALIPINWPDVFGKFLMIASKISIVSDEVFSTDCIYAILEEQMLVPSIFIKTFMTAIAPFVYMLIGVVFWLIYFKAKKRPILRNKEFTNNLISTFVIICFSLQPRVIQSSFYLLQCQNLYRDDKPIDFLSGSYDTKCWSGEHLHWVLGFAVPSLLIWVVILPSTMFYVLRKNQNRLKRDTITRRYSFIYNGYLNQKYYWEFVIMLRKIFLTTNSVFSRAKSVNLEVYISLVLLLGSHILQSWNRPFSSRELNILERTSLVSLIILNLCGIYFQIVEGMVQLDNIVIVIAVIGNLYFVIWFLKAFFLLYIEKIRSNKYIMGVYRWIYKKFCCCLEIPQVRKALLKAYSMKRRMGKIFVPANSELELTKKIDIQSFEEPISPMSQIMSQSNSMILKQMPASPSMDGSNSIALNRMSMLSESRSSILKPLSRFHSDRLSITTANKIGFILKHITQEGQTEFASPGRVQAFKEDPKPEEAKSPDLDDMKESLEIVSKEDDNDK